MGIVRRYTRGEAFWRAFRNASLVVIPSTILVALLIWWGTAHAENLDAADRQAIYLVFFAVGLMGGSLLVVFTLMGYSQYRNQKTIAELEAEEREKARNLLSNLLSRFPDLADELAREPDV
jgi:hypothetical protein